LLLKTTIQEEQAEKCRYFIKEKSARKSHKIQFSFLAIKKLRKKSKFVKDKKFFILGREKC
jgi:hypothetical protein